MKKRHFKKRYFIIPLLAITATAGVIAFHPGVAVSAPTISKSAPVNAAGTYVIDPMHTSVGFEIRHMGLSSVHGRFNRVSGVAQVDPKRLDRSSINVTIEADSIDTNVVPRDEDLRSANFFEVKKYPTLTFKSTRIRKAQKGYIADGNLTIKGVTKPISIKFNTYGPIQVGEGGKTAAHAAIIAEPFVLNRLDFGVGDNAKLPNGSPAIGNAVTVRISSEAIKTK